MLENLRRPKTACWFGLTVKLGWFKENRLWGRCPRESEYKRLFVRESTLGYVFAICPPVKLYYDYFRTQVSFIFPLFYIIFKVIHLQRSIMSCVLVWRFPKPFLCVPVLQLLDCLMRTAKFHLWLNYAGGLQGPSHAGYSLKFPSLTDVVYD